MGLLDFPLDWSVTTLIIAAFVVSIAVLVASYGMAIAWRQRKDQQRRRRVAQRRGAAGLAASAEAPAPGARKSGLPKGLAVNLRKLKKKG